MATAEFQKIGKHSGFWLAKEDLKRLARLADEPNSAGAPLANRDIVEDALVYIERNRYLIFMCDYPRGKFFLELVD